MEKVNLNGKWMMRRVNGGEWLPSTVPGSVYADLLDAKKMEDPFWRDNETAALALMEHDYEYERKFSITADMLGTEHIILHCGGIDTLADLYINGKKAGSADNMHRTWEFDVKGLLREGENTLRVVLYSPTEYICESYKENPNDGSDYAMLGFANLRKAHCMFGWDWGPRLPDAGIWRSIELVFWNTARLESVLVRQQHEEGKATLVFEPEISGNSGGLTVKYEVSGPGGEFYKTYEGKTSIEIEQPRLWWPNGYGGQPLYTVTATLCGADGEALDKWTRRIGLRTMNTRFEKDEWGEGFAHEVNGVKIFAMGADYIPEDNILRRVTPQRTRALLEDCAAANFNCIRVWGGGYYPGDEFYDMCDELGLVVWQDLMFACAVYTLTPDFEESVRAEVADNVRRLRHHPSMGLWCGNNEMEMFVAVDAWITRAQQKSDYIKMYEYIFPKLIEKLDPDGFYWPASPSSGGGFDDPNSADRGDVHYWEVWHGCKPFTEYRKMFFRYASEFGFQSFPCLKTVEAFTLPEDRNIFSYVMEKHQRNNLANGKIMEYLSQTFLYPTDFGVLLYASQLLQAEAIRYGVEHWRRNRGRCMGAIYWQLNDCWPVASWASIDYYGRWKALHYAAKRFFAPVLLSCEEEGMLSQTIDVNAQPFELKKSARFSVANETMDTFCGTVEWQLCSAEGHALEKGQKKVEVPPLTSQWLEEQNYAHADTFGNYLAYRLLGANGEEISFHTVLFCPPKHFEFCNPNLKATREGDYITITADAYARGVEIDSPDGDFVLSDNYFDMQPGSKTVKILRGNAETLQLRSVYNIR